VNFVKKPIFEENLPPVNDRETRQQILKAAQQLFLAKGYKGVSMKDVAEAVQVTSAALYHHFPDGKQEIFFSVIQMMLGEWSRGALLATSSAQGLRERLNRLTQYLFTLPIDRLAVTSSQDPITLASAVKQNVVPTLRGIDGVANVNVTGVEQQIVKVTLDLKKVQEAGLTTSQKEGVLQANNITIPAGEITSNGQLELRLRQRVRVTHRNCQLAPRLQQ
jgi:AcrR family transcriptional regulator